MYFLLKCWRLPRGIVGYALCFYTYSTWQGRTLFLEDFYVRPDYRKQRVGKMIFTEVAKHAKETNCKRLELHVLDWNPARTFYDKMGGINLTAAEGWHYCRLDRQAIESITENKQWTEHRLLSNVVRQHLFVSQKMCT